MRAIRAAIIVGVCVAPSAAFNIWPKLAAVLAGSAALDGTTAAFLIFQTAAVIVMALCLPAFERARTWSKKLAALTLACILGAINFTNALEVASHSRDGKTAAARGSMEGVTALERQLSDLRKSREQLPRFTPTSAAAVDAAKAAVTAATEARKLECCTGLGSNCRSRQDDEKAALADLAKVQNARAITERSERLDARIGETQAKLAEIGPAPKYEDGTAHRIAALFGLDEATVLEWWPIFQALAVEALALFGPFVLLHEGKARGPVVVKTAAPSPKPRKTAAPAHKSHARQAKPGPAIAPIADWLAERTAPRAGHDLKAGDAYADYQAFAASRGETATSLTAFGIAMRDDLKIQRVKTPSKRSFYRGIALAARPALAAVNG